MTAEVSSNKDLKTYILSAIGISLIFIISFLPPVEPLTPLGMKIIGIFIGMLFLWSFVSILWPSILGLLAMGVCGYEPFNKVIASAFGSYVPILILFIMIMFGVAQHYNIPQYISRWFLTRKLINGKPFLFSFVFFYTSFVMAIFVGSSLVTVFLMWPILYGLFDDVGYKKGDKYTTLMIIGTIFSAALASGCLPFMAPTVLALATFTKASSIEIPYLHYMSITIPTCTIIISLYCLAMKFIFRPDVSKMQDINIEYFNKNPLPPMDPRQKVIFYALIAYWLLIFAPSILPSSFPFMSTLKGMGPTGIIFFMIVLFSIVKFDGEPIMNAKEIFGKYVNWDIYFLLVSVLLISGALTSPVTGVSDFLVQKLSPVFAGHSPYVFILMCLTLGILFTQVANNAIGGILFMPLVVIFGIECGVNLPTIATVFSLILHCSLLTPAGSPFTSLLFGNSDWVTPNLIMKYIVFLFFLSFAVISIFTVTFADLVYSLFPIN